ncbi:MAG: hypothetical protein V3U29_05225, partial [Phycisphaeraceae bacterium]
MLAPVVSVSAQDQPPEAAALWDDFNHYVLIARPDLAGAAGAQLLAQVDDAAMLDIVEASDYTNFEQVLQRAARIESLAQTANSLSRRIQAARIERSREPARIRADIQTLAAGRRANINATERLRAAGQYAAPHLLATLLDEDQASLHPYVLAAMVAMGRPMVYPLSVALPNLEPAPMGQVAQVLGEIGYPMALPYLKQVLEDGSTDPSARVIVRAAFDQVIQSVDVSPAISAARLFMLLGENQYAAGTAGDELPGYDRVSDKGQVWVYERKVGLIPVPVPGAIFGDVQAMRSARQALALEPSMDQAFSLWLMANLRRENRLPAGEADPSYPTNLLPAAFYAKLAGHLRLHDVLARALADHDAKLARDAIAALQDTVGTEGLVTQAGSSQPLIDALSYPDRRVRYEAAFALTNARPDAPFTASHRVVPILAEAVRQHTTRHALVIADDAGATNRLQAALKDLGYQTIGGSSLSELADELDTGTGFDLIVASLSAPGIDALYRRSADHDKLA